MTNRKLRVLYITPTPNMCGAAQSLMDMIIPLSDRIEPIILTSAYGELTKECERLGYRCLVKPFSDLANLKGEKGKKNFLKRPLRHRITKYIRQDLSCSIYVIKQLGFHGVDIVHSNVSGCTIGVIISRILKVPHVWHIREALDLHFTSNICFGMKRLKRLINKAEARIAISYAIKQHLEMKEFNTFVLNDAVRSEEDVSYIPIKEKYFLFASFMLTEAKGAHLAVEAFCKSGLWKNGYSLKMLGQCSKPIKEKLEVIANHYNCKNFIEYIQFQRDVKPYFEKATAFIQGSIYEGLGRTTAEAMFFGCPVIATAYSGGTLDLVKNRETGYLFNSVEECAKLMQEVAITNQEMVIDKAQEMVLSKLTPKTYCPKILEIYYSLVNHK